LVGDTDKDKAKYQIFKHEKKFHCVTRLAYKTKDGYKGWIIQVKSGEKPKNTKK